MNKHRRLMALPTLWLGLLLCLFWTGSASAQSLISRYVAGDDYIEASQPAPVASDGKIHVAEFFLYTCPHCYHFEPALEAWRKGLDDDVVFDRVPVLFGPSGDIYARLYYTEVDMGIVDRMHDQIFDAIHQDGNPLTNRTTIRSFMVAHGVNGATFDKTFDSSKVTRQIAATLPRMRRFPVTEVPSISVAGRYWVSGRLAGSNKKMLDVVDYLIDQTRSRRANAAH
jgi:thiol:disulfide interchange protein DsbA